MFNRQTTGSCVCVFCNQLISVDNSICPYCGHKNPSLWGYSRSLRRLGTDLGFTSIVIWGCIALYLATLLTDFGNIHSSGVFDFLSPSNRSLLIFGASGAIPVFELGRWWTVLSAGWLHGNLLHIAFNLLWISRFASEVAQAFGSGRLVIIYTVATVIGFLLSSLTGQVLQGIPVLQGASFTVGSSAGLFGLLGALVAYGQITGKFAVKYQALTYAVVMFVFGLIMSEGTDNWAHFGGFSGGYIMSKTGGVDPRHREGLPHLFVAIGCLVLTMLSIFASILHGLLLPST